MKWFNELTRPVRIALVVALVALLGGGVTATTIALVSRSATKVVAGPVTPTPSMTPTPSLARTCAVADRAADPRLANLQAEVLNATTGEVLFDRGGMTASRAASVTKVPTMAAALAVLGPDYRVKTRVVAGVEPGTLVLVGGGDITLSRTPSGHRTIYGAVAHLDALADQALKAYASDPANVDVPLTKLIVDASVFGGPAWQPSWNKKEIRDGYMPPITGLMVDGDRANPDEGTSQRSTDPIGKAAKAFAKLIGVTHIENGTAPAGATVLATVSSPSVSALMERIVTYSDNTAAEMLARLTAIKVGLGNTFSAIDAGTKQGLAGYGIDTAGLHFADGSGLSDDNAITPDYLDHLFVKVAAREGNLGVILDNLPIARKKGSLSYSGRFEGPNAVVAGNLLAKTGWIDTGYTLSGIIHAKDGTLLTFTIYALGDVSDSAKQAIDTLATGFYLCGNKLANR